MKIYKDIKHIQISICDMLLILNTNIKGFVFESYSFKIYILKKYNGVIKNNDFKTCSRRTFTGMPCMRALHRPNNISDLNVYSKNGK